MDSMCVQIKQGRASKKSLRCHLARFAGLLIWFAFAVGCAVVEPPTSATETGQAPVTNEKTVTRLEAGRSGFIITETLDFPAPWRDDFERAVVLMQKNQEEQAIPVLEEIVRQSPGVTAPYINLAMAHRHADEFDRAEELLHVALELVPDHPVANNEYGLLLRQTGRFKEARDIYESTLRLFPEYLPVRRNLGILCELYLDDTACAVEQYTFYNNAYPQDKTVALWIADLNLRLGRN